ncbi:hypothetical protein CCAX7_46690 [Capsulimonas corticalis]|uniref:Uncharacterized protein n=1 Tax=Capsulimonas corticalis TaxID=2219043 RepID=A0A402CQP8_9BACT|nr:collagen-like protein [Capsulimonas corticalis]BDI32618.1 hypothetical protein CCAX7_46690 [Capsulimonas corticalis]
MENLQAVRAFLVFFMLLMASSAPCADTNPKSGISSIIPGDGMAVTNPTGPNATISIKEIKPSMLNDATISILRGKDGLPGPVGPAGSVGKPGDPGPTGPAGKDAWYYNKVFTPDMWVKPDFTLWTIVKPDTQTWPYATPMTTINVPQKAALFIRVQTELVDRLSTYLDYQANGYASLLKPSAQPTKIFVACEVFDAKGTVQLFDAKVGDSYFFYVVLQPGVYRIQNLMTNQITVAGQVLQAPLPGTVIQIECVPVS